MQNLLRSCLILAVAGFGSVIVRNVTDVLQTIAHGQAPAAVVEQPSR